MTALAVASKMLFVTTESGWVYALGKQTSTKEEILSYEEKKLKINPDSAYINKAKSILKHTKIKHGYAVIMGCRDVKLIEAMLTETKYKFLVLETDNKLAEEMRKHWQSAGIYGSRIVLSKVNPSNYSLPPYFASFIYSREPLKNGFSSKEINRYMNAIRPFGGVAVIDSSMDLERIPGADIEASDGRSILSRSGALPGTSNYNGNWQASRDELVKAPLGILWYDDNTGHFKRSPQPLFVDGVMVSQPKDWSDKTTRPYALHSAVYTDVYTGRRIKSDEELLKNKNYKLHDSNKAQPSVYRPAKQDKGNLHGKRPNLGKMINPLNGLEVKRVFPKSYGCDGGIDYGNIISLRSGTAAFYDKGLESGTIHISGPRSGCTNSIIPANGLLNLPYFYEGCSCSYPLPVALSMVKQPAIYEQWSTYGNLITDSISRLGLNFGAPGDRMTESGTLWLDTPSKGGPSPKVITTISPKNAIPYYHHSLWIRGGRGWPWVAASGIDGIHKLKIEGLKAGTFTVRLIFAETEYTEPGKRVFNVSIQGNQVLKAFDPLKVSGGAYRSHVVEIKELKVGVDGLLNVDFEALKGKPILSGISLGNKTLKLGPIPVLKERITQSLYKK